MESLFKFIFPLFIILIVIFALRRNYKQDQGQHRRAKIIHGMIIAMLGVGYAGALGTFLRTLGSISYLMANTAAVGVLPAGLHKLFLILNAVTGILVIWLLDRLIRRDQKGLKIFKMVLPLMGVLSSLNFYRAFIGETITEPSVHWTIISIALIIFIPFHLGILFIYRANFMTRFFNFDHELSLPEKAELEAMVDDIGTETKIDS